MDNSPIKKYFDSLAISWDDMCAPYPVDFDEFFSFVPFKEGMKCLDVGCGTGVLANYLISQTKCNVKAIDISEEMIKIAKNKNINKNIDFICKDLFSFDEKGFDVIVVYNCFPHFLDINGVVNQTSKLLNDSGYLVIAHDMGKDKLNDCHKNMDKTLTRDLNDVAYESIPFLKEYKLIYQQDSADKFVMLFQKKLIFCLTI